MRGLSKDAQRVLDDLVDRNDGRECEILSAILSFCDPTALHAAVARGFSAPTMRTRSSTYKRRTSAKVTVSRRSKYGFYEMEMGHRYTVDCDIHTSANQVLSAARIFAMRNNLDYWYERINNSRSVLISFTKKQPGDERP